MSRCYDGKTWCKQCKTKGPTIKGAWLLGGKLDMWCNKCKKALAPAHKV